MKSPTERSDMSLLTPNPVSTKQFNYHPETNTFTAEASDLGQGLFGRVWDDACDTGLTLVSHKTGRHVVFAISHEERDREGELLWWDLRPANSSEWGAGTVRIWND